MNSTPSNNGVSNDVNKVASPTTPASPTTSRVFVRHEFHRDHRAGGGSDTHVRAKGETAAADAKKEMRIRELAEEDARAQQKKIDDKMTTKALKKAGQNAERAPLMDGGSAGEKHRAAVVGEEDASRLSYGGSTDPLVMDRASIYHDDGSNPAPKKGSRLSLTASVRVAIQQRASRISTASKSHAGRLSHRFSGYATEEVFAERKKSLGVFTLCGLMFANSIGGGYGLEESVAAGGGLMTIMFVVVLPLIWSLPMALVVAELATSIPTNGGFLMWINVAFPAPVYFFSVFATLMLIFVDNALYPNLFAEYLCRSFECADWHQKVIKVGVLTICSFLNLIGIEAVGVASVIIMLISVCPFLLMFVWHLIAEEAYFNWEAISYVPSNIDWVAILPVVSWNVAGMEQAGAVAEDIENPQDTMVKSLIPLAIMTWLSYIPPILAGLSLSRGAVDLSIWDTGYWATVASKIGGPFLKVLTVVGGIASAFGMCMSGLCTTSRTMAGMGEAAAFPRPLSKLLFTFNKRFGTPHWAIIINTIVTGTFATFFDFSYLVVIDQVLYGIRILLIFLACIKLRYAFPTLERPYRVPVGSDKLALLLILPVLYCIVLIVVSASVDAITAGIIVAVGVGFMLFAFLYCRYFRPHGFDGKIIRVEEVVHSESCTEDDDDREASETNNNNNSTVEQQGQYPAASSTVNNGSFLASAADVDANTTNAVLPSHPVIIGSTSNVPSLTTVQHQQQSSSPSSTLSVHNHNRRSRRHVVTRSVVIEDVEGVAYGDDHASSEEEDRYVRANDVVVSSPSLPPPLVHEDYSDVEETR